MVLIFLEKISDEIAGSRSSQGSADALVREFRDLGFGLAHENVCARLLLGGQ